MTALEFRPARAEDLAAVCRFPQSAEELYYLAPRATFPFTEEQLAALVDARSDSSVVCLNGQVVGFANIYKREQDACYVGNVAVCPSARRLGVGAVLMGQMAELARQRYGAKELRVSCFNPNTAGLLLYLHLGYSPFGLEPRSKADGTSIVLVHLRLGL